MLICLISFSFLLVSIDVKAQNPVSGTFTINSALPSSETNFQTFTEAVFSLGFGVDGPVVFNVAPGSGPYVEQVNISAIPGSSATNTITFNGNGVTLENASTNPVARAVLKLDGAHNVILNNIVFHAINTSSSSTYAWGVALVRDADSNTVKNCTINIDTTNGFSGQNTIGIYIGSSDDFPDNNGISNCDYNIIDNNIIHGGYDGIDLNNYAGNFGFDFTSMDFNKVTNNKISDFLHSGIHMIWNKSTLVKGNDISVSSQQSVYGIQSDEKNGNLRIEGNRIHNFTSAVGVTDNTFKGIEIVNSPGSATTINTIANNVIYDIQTGADQEGINISGSSYINVYHNTIVLDGTPSASGNTTAGLKSEGGNSNVNFKNNIVSLLRQGAGAGYGIQVTAVPSIFVSDYNDIYTIAPNNFGRNVSTTSATLALWQSAASRDIHSTSQDPVFTDLAGGNLKPTSASIDNLGTFAGIATDINGDVRNNNTPDLGAYEFLTPPCNTPVIPGAAVGIPSAPACSGIVKTLNLAGNSFGSGQTYQWQSSATINGTYTNISSTLVVPLFDVTPSTDLYYRAVVTCGAGTAISDPILISVRHELSGTYTVNAAAPTSGTNFNSFTDVIAALDCGGIIGPVVLNVMPGSGPYNEQIILGVIPGTSATNTIQINGNGETLNYLALNTNERAVVKLNGTKYVTIDNLVINAAGTTSSQYGYGVQLLNDADYNRITNCKINVTTASTSPSYAGLLIGGLASDPVVNADSKCDFNVIANNVITGGYYGLTVSSDATLRIANDTILNNVLKDQYAYGIYIKGTDRCLVEGNDVSRPARTTTTSSYTGIYLNGVSTSLTVSKNKVHGSHTLIPNDTNTPIAIFSNNCDAASTAKNFIINNLVYDFGALGSLVGIQNTGSDYTEYYHNTISFDRKTGSPTAARTTRAFYQTTTAVGLVFSNNNVTITRSGLGTNTAIYMNANATAYVASNNNYYVAGSGVNTIGFKNAVVYTTIETWKTGSANDANSLSIDPAYADLSTGNLSPTNLELDNKGVFAGITTDINNFSRSATTPDIGAYEFIGALPVKLLSFSAVKAGDDVAVKWATSTEQNTKNFTIERSTDAANFVSAGIVQARGNSSVTQYYNFTDVKAAGNNTRVLYYRLKITDNDGHVEYSSVLAVRLGNEEKVSISVQPNPFVSELFGRISTNTAGKASIRITDLSGRVISRQTAVVNAGTNLISIDRVSQLPKGMYIVTIEVNNNTYVQKVIR
ncbi:T9SS type A sorting domain-containing protein [Ferruginibacter sp. HRS2-29]|uniref:T9SS type A sorting domain-containing protein n=1 Tax=Ferruginibacter sp. HRS2-29 TaxID=2487334 RepID=UPI0020CFE498|nr:T9SS type A sorting domain-containing protein [Ferruginibacter sp. HRS2-29]